MYVLIERAEEPVVRITKVKGINSLTESLHELTPEFVERCVAAAQEWEYVQSVLDRVLAGEVSRASAQ